MERDGDGGTRGRLRLRDFEEILDKQRWRVLIVRCTPEFNRPSAKKDKALDYCEVESTHISHSTHLIINIAQGIVQT